MLAPRAPARNQRHEPSVGLVDRPRPSSARSDPMTPLLPALLALALGAASPHDPSQDRLYGRVVTAAGAVFEGFIRWDKNAGSWDDLLNGMKDLPSSNRRDAERLRGSTGGDRTFNILGLRISWDRDED